MSARVAALDYLGIITARLRKDVCTSANQSTINDLLLEVNEVTQIYKVPLTTLLAMYLYSRVSLSPY